MDELTIDGKAYIPAKQAAAITGYAKDYVGQLCREGRVEARLVGRSWYVLESSIREHRFGIDAEKEASNDTPPKEAEDEIEPVTSSVDETWKYPTYTAETIPPLPTIETTKLENTSSNVNLDTLSKTDPKIDEMQTAWKEWFTTREETQEDTLNEERAMEEPSREEKGEEVAITRLKEAPVVAASIDIPVNRTVEARTVSLISAVKQKRVSKTFKEPKVKKAGNPIVKAALAGFVLVVICVVLLGTGLIETVNSSNTWNSFVTDFLGGVQRIDK